MAKISSRWIKPGAIFASAEDARTNLKSQMPAEHYQLTRNNDDELLSRGILLRPVEFVWNQEDHSLTLIRHCTSIETYYENRSWDASLNHYYNQLAGWIFDGIQELP